MSRWDLDPVESDFSRRKMVIATACLLGSTFVPYVQATISPLMMLPMTREFGWGRTDYAFASAFFFLFGSVTVLLFGRIADRIGVRPVLLAGAILGGAAMLAMSFQTSSLWRLYATYALLGSFGSSGVGYTKVIGALFTRHRGKALAVFGAESTVALAVLPMLTNALIAHVGWRGTYFSFGLLSFAVVPLVYFLISEPGASAARRRWKGRGVPAQNPGPRTPQMAGMTAAQVRRDKAFWLIVLGAVLFGGLNQGMLTHVIAAISDKGFSTTVAAELLSISTLMGLIGTVAAGVTLDSSRTARPVAIFAFLAAIGALLFALASKSFGGLPLLIAAMSIQGAAMAAMRPIATYLQTRFFGLRAFAETTAIQIVFQGMAMAISPPLFGIIYDREGSYQPVYWLLVGAAVLGSFVYLSLGPYRYATQEQPQPDEMLAAGVPGPSVALHMASESS